MNAINPLRKLLGLRQRRQERFETEVREQIKRTHEAEQVAAAARDHQASCAAREQVVVGKRQQVTERSFAPVDLITADFAVKAAAGLTQAAAGEVAKAETAAKTQVTTLAACRAQAARNLQRVDDLKERLAKALRDREERAEEVDAEESEETAAARIAGRRAAREEAARV
jgi:Bacterial type III secretion protein (HrpB7)